MGEMVLRIGSLPRQRQGKEPVHLIWTCSSGAAPNSVGFQHVACMGEKWPLEVDVYAVIFDEFRLLSPEDRCSDCFRSEVLLEMAKKCYNRLVAEKKWGVLHEAFRCSGCVHANKLALERDGRCCGFPSGPTIERRTLRCVTRRGEG